jgi:uncharacterized protein GlcG (DUF336 family)
MNDIPAGYVRRLSYREARIAIDAALAKADELGVPSSVAVIDAGRELVAFARQEDSMPISADMAVGKAYTARSVNGPSAQLLEASKPSGPFWGVQHGVRAPMVTFGGGFPIEIDATVVGAIGASGGSIEEDEAVATAGLDALLAAL